MKKLLSRLVSAVLILAALYLIPVNLALNLPATRSYLNSIRPDQFAVTWERAWSLYPLRFELTDLAADGQTPTEQWQVDAKRAAAAVSLLALLKGEMRLHDLDLADIDLRLRPRPKPEDDYADIAQYFPVIRNRDPDAPAEPAPLEEGGSVTLEIEAIRIEGEHAFWVSHIRGALPGEVRGSVRMDTKAGRLSLAGGALDLVLESLRIADQTHVTEGASLKGRIEIPPFTLSATRGLEFLRVGELDAQIDLPVQNLDFLVLLMPPAGAMELSGQGRLRGRVVLSGGEALQGTDLVVEAHELAMNLGPYEFGGDGSVEFMVDPADEAQADLIVRFDQVRAELGSVGATDAGAPQVLFSGRGLTAQLHAAETDPTTTSTAVRAEDLLSEVELTLLLTVPSMEVADLAVYNRLFPEGWDLELLGGAGTVSGKVEVTSKTLSLDMDLASNRADLRYKHYHATADLLLQLRGMVDQAAGATLHLDGTSLRIDDAEIVRAGGTGASVGEHRIKPWTADFRIAQGTLTLPTPVEGDDADPIPSVAKVLEDRGFGALIANADGRLSSTLTVSRLDWIAELLNRPLGLSLTGSGELDAEIVLADGLPARCTTLRVPRQSLSLISGEASLVGDLRFKPDSAKGELLLVAEGVRMLVDQEELSGDLRVDLLVRDGSAEDMRFDITGSSIVLDDVQAFGKVGSARAPDWHARLQLEETEVLWHKPMHLDMTAGINIKDTRPFIALLDDMRGEHGWIDNLLIARDLGGHLKLALDGKRALLSDAMIGSEQISVGAKGRADVHGREGMVYVRWHDLTGAMELQGGEKHFDIANARKRFDAYVPGRAAVASQRHKAKAIPPRHTQRAFADQPRRRGQARSPRPRSITPPRNPRTLS